MHPASSHNNTKHPFALTCVSASLKAQGTRFPAIEGAAPVFTPPSHATPGTGAPAEPRVTSTQTMEKLEADLQVSGGHPRMCQATGKYPSLPAILLSLLVVRYASQSVFVVLEGLLRRVTVLRRRSGTRRRGLYLVIAFECTAESERAILASALKALLLSEAPSTTHLSGW